MKPFCLTLAASILLSTGCAAMYGGRAEDELPEFVVPQTQ